MSEGKSIKELAEAIDDSYEDFVRWVTEFAEERADLEPKLRQFITGKTNITSSDVLEYIDDVLDPK